MLSYNTPQTTVNINGTLIGGQPGENPIAMSGSIFFAGHSIVTDPIRGEFNQELAHKLLYEEARLAEDVKAGTKVPKIAGLKVPFLAGLLTTSLRNFKTGSSPW